MAEQDFINAFNDCIDRLAGGQTLDDCLRRYPQFAPILRPMLEAGQTVRRANFPTADVAQAQARVRYRVVEAMRTAQPETAYPLRRLAVLGVSFLIIFMVISGSAGILAQSSLPGDSLYGLKRLTENVQLTLSSNDDALEPIFATRRIEEIQQVLALRRSVEVSFTGRFTSIQTTIWTIAGLPVHVQAGTPGSNVAQIGDQVEVQAYTTNQGELVARSITRLDSGELPVVPIVPTTLPTPVPTRILPIPTTTDTPAPTITLTFTPTSTLTPSPTLTHTVTTLPVTLAPTTCAPRLPTGWVRYSIQTGDTLSAIAAAGGISVEELMEANCLTDRGFITVGQKIYAPVALPERAVTQPQPTIQPDTSGNDNTQAGTDDNSEAGDNQNANDNDGDDHSDNDNHDGGSDDNHNDNDG